jgi:hypothetical protein
MNLAVTSAALGGAVANKQANRFGQVLQIGCNHRHREDDDQRRDRMAYRETQLLHDHCLSWLSASITA